MISMKIKLDKAKLRKDGYDFMRVQALVDKRFSKACEKRNLKDGSFLYQGIEGKDYFTEICIAYVNLRKQDWFATYCCAWKWYEDDKKNNKYEEDLLAKERTKNPLFYVRQRGQHV